MAVTISVAELVDELRVGSSPEELAQVTRLHGYASEAVIRHASGATDAAHNEAVVRLAAYLYDQPSVTRADGFSNALRSSGAARILLPYRIHRAGTTAEAVTVAEQSGSVDNPVIDVSVVSNTLTVVYSDGTSASFPLASGSGDAQSIVDAHAMEANAHHVPPAGVGQGITQAALDTAIETHTDAATAHHAPPTHGTELALKVERADVSAGVGIAVSAVPNSQPVFPILGVFRLNGQPKRDDGMIFGSCKARQSPVYPIRDAFLAVNHASCPSLSSSGPRQWGESALKTSRLPGALSLLAKSWLYPPSAWRRR